MARASMHSRSLKGMSTNHHHPPTSNIHTSHSRFAPYNSKKARRNRNDDASCPAIHILIDKKTECLIVSRLDLSLELCCTVHRPVQGKSGALVSCDTEDRQSDIGIPNLLPLSAIPTMWNFLILDTFWKVIT